LAGGEPAAALGNELGTVVAGLASLSWYCHCVTTIVARNGRNFGFADARRKSASRRWHSRAPPIVEPVPSTQGVHRCVYRRVITVYRPGGCIVLSPYM
jgi:hypothetical protein